MSLTGFASANIGTHNISNGLADHKAQNYAPKAKSSFSAMLSESIHSSETKRPQKPHLEKEVDKVAEEENNYCSVCGSMIDEEGNCPICTVPIFIHGSESKNFSRADSLQSTAESKSAVLPLNK